MNIKREKFPSDSLFSIEKHNTKEFYEARVASAHFSSLGFAMRDFQYVTLYGILQYVKSPFVGNFFMQHFGDKGLALGLESLSKLDNLKEYKLKITGVGASNQIVHPEAETISDFMNSSQKKYSFTFAELKGFNGKYGIEISLSDEEEKGIRKTGLLNNFMKNPEYIALK